MSVRHIAHVLTLSVPNPTAKLILIALADCMNAETGRCFPSKKYLAEVAGCSVDTVKRHLRVLEEGGFIKREARFIDGRQTTSMVSLTLGQFQGGVQIAPPGGVGGAPPVTRSSNQDICPIFLQAWAIGPKNKNDNRLKALKAWNARVREGVDPQDLLEGRKRYAAYCEAEQTEPRYIRHLATLFGPNRWWEQEWTAAEAVPETRSGVIALARKHNVTLRGDIDLPQARQVLAKELGMRL